MAKRTPRQLRIRRHQRLRKRVFGQVERPRLSVFRSNMHIYAQIIDDTEGRTLVAASTVEADARGQTGDLEKIARAQLVGRMIAERARAAGISAVVFDRGGFQYHGRVKALADAAREAGLNF